MVEVLKSTLNRNRPEQELPPFLRVALGYWVATRLITQASGFL